MNPLNRIIADTLTALNSLIGYRIDFGWVFDRLLGVGDVAVLDGFGNRLRIPSGLAGFIRGIEIRKPIKGPKYFGCAKEWWIREDEAGRRTIDMKHVLGSYCHIDEMLKGLSAGNKDTSALMDPKVVHRHRFDLIVEMYYLHIEIPFREQEKRELEYIIGAYVRNMPKTVQNIFEAMHDEERSMYSIWLSEKPDEANQKFLSALRRRYSDGYSKLIAKYR